MSYENILTGMAPGFIDTHGADAFMPSGCSDAVFVHNPAATRQAETPQAIATMQKACEAYGLALTVTETSPDVEGNVDMLQEHVGEKSLIIVRAGDGGLNKLLTALRVAELGNPVLAQPGGNKNDIVRQLFGRAFRKSPESALHHSVVRTVHPIELTLSRADGSQSQYDAYGYASKGVTVDVARIAGSEEWRTQQAKKPAFAVSIAEKKMAALGVLRAKRYQLALNGGEPQEVVDFILGNGSSMAGTMDLGHNLFEPGFRKIVVRTKLGGIVTTLATIAHLPVGRRVAADECVSFHVSGDPDYIQADGDAIALTGPTTVRARVADTGVNMLASLYK